MLVNRPNRIAIGAALLALALSATPAMAQWKGKGEAGIAIANGNSDTKTANAKIGIGKKVDAWEHLAGIGTLYIKSNSVTTAKRWELNGQTRYSFSGNTYWYGGGRYEQDKFSGFDHQGIVSSGLGRRFIDNDTTKFSGQVGLGYKFSETVFGIKDSSVAGVGNLDYDHKLNDQTTVFDHFSTEIASGNTFFQNDIGVAVKMSANMALALAYGVRHNTKPPAGFKKTDTLTTFNLVYEIK
jgi:putative salt-induced outer membrane protein